MSVTVDLRSNPASINLGGMTPLGLAETAGAAAQAQMLAQAQGPQKTRPAVSGKTAKPAILSDALLGEDIPFERLSDQIAQGIEDSIHASRAAGAEAQVLEEFSSALRDLLGDMGQAGSLDRWFTDLTDGEQASAQRLLDRARVMTDGLTSISDRIDGLRNQADQHIDIAIDQVNGLLNKLAGISHQITVDAACGDDVTPLFEQRDEQVTLLFGLLDVVSFIRTDGAAALYTRGGTPLINGPQAKRLCFTHGAAITVDGVDISKQIASGRLFGLLSLRDDHLLGLQGQLDSLAHLLREQINRLFNRAIADVRSASNCYAGNRIFLNPEDERLVVSGGDTVITLYGDKLEILAATGLIHLMRDYLQSIGLPHNNSWSIAQFTQALDRWLRRVLNSDATCAFLDDAGRVNIALARGRLTLRDQRSTALDSTPQPDPTKALGLSGALAFSDIFGNKFAVTVSAQDSLQGIAAQVESFSGLKTAIVGHRNGHMLRIHNAAGCDLYLEPDARPVAPANSLRFLPAGQLPAGDVTVDWDGDGQGASMISNPMDEHDVPLGIDGTLTIASHDGGEVSLLIAPATNLANLVAQINAAAEGSGISAMLKAAGNRWIVRLSGQPGQTLRAEGAAAQLLGLRPPPDMSSTGFASFLGLNDFFTLNGKRACHDSKPLPDSFTTFAPGSLILTQRGGRRRSIALAGGLTLEQVAAAVNAPCDDAIAQAELIRDGADHHLRLTALDGADLQITGSIAVNLALGDVNKASARALATRNDLLPEFLPPTAAALFGEAMAATITIPNGNALPQGPTSLRDAAIAIAQRNQELVNRGRSMLLYQQTLMVGLQSHRKRLDRATMNSDATLINTYRDAFLESASVLSSLSQLTQALH